MLQCNVGRRNAHLREVDEVGGEGLLEGLVVVAREALPQEGVGHHRQPDHVRRRELACVRVRVGPLPSV